MNTPRPTFTLQLRYDRDGDDINALKRMFKSLGRHYSFKRVSIRETSPDDTTALQDDGGLQ